MKQGRAPAAGIAQHIVSETGVWGHGPCKHHGYQGNDPGEVRRKFGSAHFS